MVAKCLMWEDIQRIVARRIAVEAVVVVDTNSRGKENSLLIKTNKRSVFFQNKGKFNGM